MCLQTNWQNPRTATRNIIVYKLFQEVADVARPLEKILKSPFWEKYYNLGKLYKARLGKTTDMSSFDTEATRAFNDNKTRNTISIGAGFHSAASIERLKDAGDNDRYKIYKCVIPKGAEYYRGFSNLLVSNRIIVQEKVKL